RLLEAADLPGDPGQVLDVVTVFVSDHVVAGEVAAGAHLAVELVVEGGVDVDRLVGRAVERPHRARRRAAAGPHPAAGYEVQRRLAEGDPGLAEGWLPGLVEVHERVAG